MIVASTPTTIIARTQSIVSSVVAGRMRGAWRCCAIAPTTPNTAKAASAAMKAGNSASGEMPANHIIVVVVSPITLPVPPAFAAATMDTKNPMPTFPW
jgi:hypothetical protein